MTAPQQGNWLGRNLENYKEMHKGTAKDKDCYEEFMRTKTLTKARKILFGAKKGSRD